MKGPWWPRLARGAAVSAMVAALGVAPPAPASAQEPSLSRGRSADAAQGEAAIMAALKRDLGLAGAELAEVVAASAQATKLDARLRGELGGEFAGSWFDRATRTLTVAVTGRGAASVARDAGAETVVVGRGERDLMAITEALSARVEDDPDAWVEVISWGVDVRANQVLVTVRAGQAGPIESLVAEYGDAVRIDEAEGEPRLTAPPDPFLDGGEPLDTNSGGACSTSFNMRSISTGVQYVATASHCGTPGDWAFSYGVTIGPFVSSWLAFGDALVRVDNPFWIEGPWVWTWPGFITIGGWTDAPVGTPVCKSGRVTRAGRP